MIRYINWKTSQGVETVDELDSNDFERLSAFYKALRRLVSEYIMAYNDHSIYSSQRCSNDWRERPNSEQEQSKELRTTREYVVENYKPSGSILGFGKVTVPKGTLCTHMTATGIDKNYHFVKEIDKVLALRPDVAALLKHDLKYYGINVPKEYFN